YSPTVRLGGAPLSPMRGDLPGVTPFVFHHTATVPIGHLGWLFVRASARVQSALICRVGVVDIYVEKGGHRATNSGVASYDYRVADPDLGWKVLPILSRCAEHLREELYELFCVVSHDSWSNGVPAFRGEMVRVGCFFHLTVPWFEERLLRRVTISIGDAAPNTVESEQPLSSIRFRDALTAAQDVASRRAIHSRGCYTSRCRVPSRRGELGGGG